MNEQKNVLPDEMYFLEEDFAGRMTRVAQSDLERWHKEQAKLKEKLDRGEIPDPNIPTQEELDLMNSLFGRRRTPEEAE